MRITLHTSTMNKMFLVKDFFPESFLSVALLSFPTLSSASIYIYEVQEKGITQSKVTSPREPDASLMLLTLCVHAYQVSE